ncbi:hypothetical protein FORC44_3232 [Escherichia coli]|nr:hypothetical protein FORC44_3232 [Escherichia coli]EKI13434.1 hypothetical protein EC5412_1668 [Escherichia coli 5412]
MRIFTSSNEILFNQNIDLIKNISFYYFFIFCTYFISILGKIYYFSKSSIMLVIMFSVKKYRWSIPR